MEVALVGIGLAGLLLVVQRWFWIIVFFVAGTASLFAMLASIIHFQILGALGFMFLMFISYAFMNAIAE